jgi:hypothetical protein
VDNISKTQLIGLLFFILPMTAQADLDIDAYKCKYVKPQVEKRAQEVNVKIKLQSRRDDPVCIAHIHCDLNAIVESGDYPPAFDEPTTCLPDPKSKKCTKSLYDCMIDEDVAFDNKTIGDSLAREALQMKPRGTAK